MDLVTLKDISTFPYKIGTVYGHCEINGFNDKSFISLPEKVAGNLYFNYSDLDYMDFNNIDVDGNINLNFNCFTKININLKKGQVLDIFGSFLIDIPNTITGKIIFDYCPFILNKKVLSEKFNTTPTDKKLYNCFFENYSNSNIFKEIISNNENQFLHVMKCRENIISRLKKSTYKNIINISNLEFYLKTQKGMKDNETIIDL